ncbi:MAG: DUF4126 domain-containing protein [Myxococcota bacterium]
MPVPFGDGLGAALCAVALGASCGLRIFLAPFVCALVALLGQFETGSASWLGHPAVAALAILFLLAELGADKVDGLDQALDAAGIVLRPLWAAALTHALIPAAPVAWPIAAAAMAAALAFGKARLRLEARASLSESSARGVVGPLLSLAEDVGVAGLVLAALALPVVGLAGAGISAAFLHGSASAVRRRRWRQLLAG